MTVESVIVKLFENKGFPIGDKYVNFGYNHNLTVNTGGSSIKGQYSFTIKAGRIILKTDIPLIDNEQELAVEIVIGGQVVLLFS
jgi:hypothetical protein